MAATRRTVRFAEGPDGTYTKYFPRQERIDSDPRTGERIRVTINSRGFRGPEFADAKAPGVRRLITLGASSTFGFRNRDDETYPRYLARILEQRCPAGRFEVINLGIPHLETSQILALYRNEGLPLDPDVVTFYEGVNDAEGFLGRSEVVEGLRGRLRTLDPLRSGFRVLRDQSLLVGLLDQALLQQMSDVSPSDLDAVARRKTQRFLDNVSEIDRLSRDHGILFVVASQQMKSGLVPPERMGLVTYGDEVRAVEQELARAGALTEEEAAFLVHARMMRALEAWAAANRVAFADVIRALDRQRDQLVSRVHLSPRANRLIAETLAEVILARLDECHGEGRDPARDAVR